MSQRRFTVSKSDGDPRPADIQGEVNQLFEGDEPTSNASETEAAAGAEVVVVLKGKRRTSRRFLGVSGWLQLS